MNKVRQISCSNCNGEGIIYMNNGEIKICVVCDGMGGVEETLNDKGNRETIKPDYSYGQILGK